MVKEIISLGFCCPCCGQRVSGRLELVPMADVIWKLPKKNRKKKAVKG